MASLQVVILCFALYFDVIVMSHVVTVDLTVDGILADLDLTCIGEDVALTDTSVQLQYREVYNSSVAEWVTLDVIRIGTFYNQTRNLTYDSESDVLGMQFRLLQLEHGGSECNCWEIVSLKARIDNMDSPRSISHPNDTCVKRSTSVEKTRMLYCRSQVYDARGVITTVLYFINKNLNGCPNTSEEEIISYKGPPLSEDCSTAIPRL